jgi:hypothetical protein
MSEGKKRSLREVEVIVATIEDQTLAGCPTVNVTMPADAASKVIESSLGLYRELDELRDRDPVMFSKHQVLRLKLEELEESMTSAGVFAAFKSETSEDDESSEEENP